MSLTFIILFGLLIGVIANLLDPRKEGGILGPVIIGVLGSITGSVMASMIFNLSEGGSFSILVTSMVVSSLLLFVSWALKPLRG
jgi:uncharacterized membrane protein YeaQ/YmgE (transglycosylase-associated protein family)